MSAKRALRNWPTFQGLARPVWASLYRRFQHCPTKRQLIAAGHSDLANAAIFVHGGLNTVHRKLGYQPWQCKHNHRPYRIDWHQLSNREAFFRDQFPELWALGIAPSYTDVKQQAKGLIRFSQRFPGKWSELLHRHHLVEHTHGQVMRENLTDIMSVLTFFEHHRRWPRSTECRDRLRKRHYPRDVSWEQWLVTRELTVQMVERVIQRMHQHHLWCSKNQPSRVDTIYLLLHKLVAKRQELHEHRSQM